MQGGPLIGHRHQKVIVQLSPEEGTLEGHAPDTRPGIVDGPPIPRANGGGIRFRAEQVFAEIPGVRIILVALLAHADQKPGGLQIAHSISAHRLGNGHPARAVARPADCAVLRKGIPERPGDPEAETQALA
jgi:hypothetical protein